MQRNGSAKRAARNVLAAVGALTALTVVAPATVTATSTADLSVRKYGVGERVRVGDAFEYRIQVRNGGPASAHSVTLKDDLPPNFEVTSQPRQCSRSGRTLRCHLGTLRSGAYLELSLSGRFTKAGTYRNVVRVSSPKADPRGSNNVDDDTTTATARQPPPPKPPAQGPTDLAADKQGPSTAVAGQSVTFTITASNLGPNRANQVLVEDTLPTNFTVTGKPASCEARSPSVLLCTIGSIDAGRSRTLTITGTFRADPTDNPMSVNTAKVFLDADGDLDPDATNNVDSTSTAVAGAPGA